MKSHETIGSVTVTTPGKIEVAEALDNIEEATFIKEKEAERLGKSVEEYENEHKEKTPLITPLNNPPQEVPQQETKTPQSVEDFVVQWQKENSQEGQANYEKLTAQVEVKNDLPIPISNLFLSHIIRKARFEMRNNSYYEKFAIALDSLDDVYLVTIKKSSDNTIKFEVFTNKRYFFKKRNKLTIFKMDSTGRVILP